MFMLMIKTAVGGLFSLFTGKSNMQTYLIVAIAGIVLVPNLSKLGAKLGFQTKAALQQEVKDNAAEIAVLHNANKTLGTTVANQEASGEATVAAVTDKFTEDKKYETDATVLISRSSEKIAKIQKAAPVKPTPVEQQQTDQKIASVQIDSLWESYCSFNTAEACLPTPAS